MRKALLIFLFSLAQVAAIAQDLSDREERRQTLEKEIEFINSQLESISSRQKASTEQLVLIQQKISARKKLLKKTDDKIAGIEGRIAAKDKEISRLNAELDTLRAYYNKLICNTYKNRDTRVWFLYVLSSQDIGQGYRRMSYFKGLAGQVSSQKKVIAGKQAVLEKQRDSLAVMRQDAIGLKNARKQEYRRLLDEENQSKKSIKSLSKSQAQYKRELAQKKKESDRLNREIEKMVRGKSETDLALSGDFEQNCGKLPWPVNSGVITEQFGINSHPIYKNLKMPQSNGLTFRTEKNAEVYCVFDGVVSNIVVVPGYSQCVLVQHGSYFTFYCKLGSVRVTAGQKVKAGECLGNLDTDESNGSSLHFQIWKGTQKQNPQKWLRE